MRLIQTTELPLEALVAWPKAADLFSRYTRDQQVELNAFQNRHGEDAVLPIVVSADYRVVDGYNRWDAAVLAKAATISAQVYAYSDEQEMEIHAIVLNCKRRHLDGPAAARAAVNLAKLMGPTEAETRQKESAAGKRGGRGKKRCTPADVHPLPAARPATGGSFHKNLRCFDTCDCSHPRTAHNKRNGSCRGCECKAFTIAGAPATVKHRESTIEKAAKQIGVSPKTVRQVAKVDATDDRGLIEAMNQKLVGVDRAAKIADLPPDQRERALAVIRSEMQPSITGMQRLAEGLRTPDAAMYVAGCVDANIRMKKGADVTDLEALSDEQLQSCKGALGGVAMLCQQLADKLQAVITSRKSSDIYGGQA